MRRKKIIRFFGFFFTVKIEHFVLLWIWHCQNDRPTKWPLPLKYPHTTHHLSGANKCQSATQSNEGKNEAVPKLHDSLDCQWEVGCSDNCWPERRPPSTEVHVTLSGSGGGGGWRRRRRRMEEDRTGSMAEAGAGRPAWPGLCPQPTLPDPRRTLLPTEFWAKQTSKHLASSSSSFSSRL